MGSTPESKEVARKPRFPIGLPTWHEKRLIWWAYVKQTSKTSLAQNVLQARIEANDEMIQAALAELAADAGLTVEQLKADIIQGTSLDAEE